jgi:hypothetical protein
VRIVHWFLYVLAILVFVAPAIYLVQVWPRTAPPATTEVDRARVEATSHGYRIILPGGASYQLARSEVIGSDKRGAAMARVHSLLASENSAHRHSWARFWFLLAGACFVAMVLTFASQLIKTSESR